MLFRRDNEQERGIWVDRGIDGRVDDFQVCRPCSDSLGADDPDGRRWHDGEELCPTCRAEFQARALVADIFSLPRPFNGDIEGRYVTNEEFAEDVRPGLREALDYFLPGQGDGFLPSRGDGFTRDSLDGFLPGRGDSLGPGPGDGFLPGRDAFGPGPGDGLSHGRGDAFGPGAGDTFQPDPYDRFFPGQGDYFMTGMQDDLMPE